MKNISLLLNEALTPYRVTLEGQDSLGNCQVVVMSAAGSVVTKRLVNRSQFEDLRSFTDVVDGLHRDLLVAEGRLEPSMIAVLRNVSQNAAFSHALV
ncbi:hypothetical protein AHFPHNDE_03293 [Pseudomonas sp. MM227]|uniref:DUF3509 domain-containing protein n=1 Tax=Pseudomonas sp. MM227 TaxID=3019968 RepID=UPI00221EA0BB|nr:DUF3509 domain-containing protein [Pseudomonas sp. MM227]CAI3789590.1 hypothetical protein AHFPHNDE_03293 [Pseudomonas sp. MM227]